MKPLIPYIRQSRAKEKTISLDDQRAAIQKWAKDNNVPLAAEVVEQGVSGSKSWRDRELGAALAAVQDGKAGGLIVAFQDRLSRENGLATAEVWNALEAADARLVCACEGLDTARRSDDDELVFSMKAALARMQWKRHRKNWANTDAACAEKGVYQGLTPVGYDKIGNGLESKLVKNTEALHVKRAFEMRSSGASYSKIGRMLADAGVKTATGLTKWGVTSISSMLRNPVYKGTISNGTEHTHAHLMIVSPSLWDSVQPREGVTRGPRFKETITYDVRKGIIRKRENLKQAPAGDKQGRQDGGEWAVLGGLVKCGGCDKRMAPNTDPKPSGKVHRFYACKRIDCTQKARALADELHEYVVESAYAYFEQAVAMNGGAHVGRNADTEEIGRLEIALADAKARRRAAVSAGLDVTDADDRAVLDTLKAAVDTAATALKAERSSARVPVSPSEMRAAFEAADVTSKRGLVREMLNGITVHGGIRSGALSDRVELDYRVLIYPEAA